MMCVLLGVCKFAHCFRSVRDVIVSRKVSTTSQCPKKCEDVLACYPIHFVQINVGVPNSHCEDKTQRNDAFITSYYNKRKFVHCHECARGCTVASTERWFCCKALCRVHIFYRQLDFSSEPGVASEILENEAESCLGVAYPEQIDEAQLLVKLLICGRKIGCQYLCMLAETKECHIINSFLIGYSSRFSRKTFEPKIAQTCQKQAKMFFLPFSSLKIIGFC